MRMVLAEGKKINLLKSEILTILEQNYNKPLEEIFNRRQS